MRPTLPVVRVRPRSPTTSSSSSSSSTAPQRNNLLTPLALVVVFLVVAVAAPSTFPHAKWLSLAKLTNSTEADTAAVVTSTSTSTTTSNTNYNNLVSDLTPPDHSSTSTSTSTSSVAFNEASTTTRPTGRRLQSSTETEEQQTTTNTKPLSVPSTDTNANTQPPQSPPQIEQQSQSKQTATTATTPPPPSSSNTETVNLAYFIQLSEATIAHLPRLLNRIYHKENVYAIHFDKKVDQGLTNRLRKKLFKKNPSYKENVIFMPSELITYRGVSMLLNTINAMRILMDFKKDWDYFINISGADYPLISQDYLRELLYKYKDEQLNFFTFAPEKNWQMNLKYRLENIYVDEALSFQENQQSEVKKLGVINPLAHSMKLTYTNAEAWMINSRKFCQYTIHSSYARKLLLTFAYSVESSEHYFATLVWNHPILNRTIINDAMRGVLWFYEGKPAGQHPFYVDDKKVDGSFMFRDIMMEIPTFFIRKFKHADSPLMDYLDKQWTNETHVKRVKEKLDWHVQVSKDEHALKPAIPQDVIARYSLSRRRRRRRR